MIRIPNGWRPPKQLGDGEYLLDDADGVAFIGAGTFGSVWRYRKVRMSNRRCAVKFVVPEYGSMSPEIMRAEADLLDQLTDAPNIVDVEDTYVLEGEGVPRAGLPCLAIVMKLVNGRQLHDYRGGRASPEEARLWTLGIAHGLRALHRLEPGPRAHLDLKPANVMVLDQSHPTEGQPQIVDLGLAAVQIPVGVVAGTKPYLAPEQWRRRPVPASDLWALGLIAFELASQHTIAELFHPTDQETTGRPALELRDRVLERIESVPDTAMREAIRGLLAVDPADRFDYIALRALLQHASPTYDESGRRESLWRRILAVAISAVAAFDVVLVSYLLLR